MKENFFISYSRGSVYADGTKDAIIIIDDEKTSENLDELISPITNNYKFLGTREEDVIDFSKKLELTSFEYLVKNNNHEVVHCHSLRHEVVIKLGYIHDIKSCKKFYSKFNIDQHESLDEYSALLNYKLFTPELASKFNIEESSFTHVMGEYEDSYIFKCNLKNPFYLYDEFYKEFSEKYNLPLKVFTLNTDVELYQSYDYGNRDEGMIDGECNWEYLNDDYIEGGLEYLKKMNLN